MAPEAIFAVACDIGGTFTDLVLHDEASATLHSAKLLTTPQDPSIAMLEGLALLAHQVPGYVARTRRVAHATTLIANAVIERKGARCALLCTAGFRDCLEMRRHVRVTTYELWIDPPTPLVPRYLRLPVAERTYSDGTILQPVDPDEIDRIAAFLLTERVESVAIAFLHSYVNPANELAAERALGRALPGVAITTSAAVLRQIKEFERTSTTVVNAYVKPLAARYLARLDSGLGAAGFRPRLEVMLSNGGLGAAKTAGEFPIRLLESGPVAGAIIARHYAMRDGIDNLLAFDMGGTTAKACLIQRGEIPITDELEVARSQRFTRSSGLPVAVPAAHLIEVGAGGGSLARLNALGLVQVGPESAGAEPGPVAYGRGGTAPTVTDADLVLGYLNPDYFAAGSMRLDRAAAAASIVAHVGKPSGRDLLGAAWTIHDVVNETMASAVRMHVTERGGRLEDAVLAAFGGAGPVHACNLATKLGIRRLLVPLRAGVLSAVGLLVAPPAYDQVQTVKRLLAGADTAEFARIFAAMAEEIRGHLAAVETGAAVTFQASADIGYAGQGYQIRVPLAGMDAASLTEARLASGFAQHYRSRYGYFYDDVPVEVVHLRLSGHAEGPRYVVPEAASQPRQNRGSAVQRQAFSARRQALLPFAVHQRPRLEAGDRFSGPAIIEEDSCTTVVDVGTEVEVDRFGSLAITIMAEGERL
ncbi:MAG: hydantoinase/oxoprolinase family protein [Alphaproteobacteria bacterium]|nr:hydantoinase/oxoprolinase family protein [Alphaproteobacteria bacterium]